MKITILSDSDGGFAKVRRALLNKLDIDSKISQLSYQRGQYAFLAELSDAVLLYKALNQNGILFTLDWRHTHKVSKVRGYEIYQASKID
jgi:hypothetical protein